MVAQALDYASWVEELQAEDIAAIYRRFKLGQSLSDDFKARFGQQLDEDALNQRQQIVIVAALLDDSTERIVAYHREFTADPERSEWFVPVEWLKVVPLDQAVKEIGFFGNQNTVCKPTTPKWRSTVDRLKERFGIVSA